MDQFPRDLPDHLLISDVKIDNSTELGRGSDASVFRGTWHGAPVAVKVLHRSLIQTGSFGRLDFLAKFSSECERMQRLQHPCIVQFLGVFRTEHDVPALVTELMDCSLLDRYEALPALTRRQQLVFLSQAASGLSYLHAQGFVHRDLKTSNVLVTRGDGGAKLADMGVARSLHGSNPVSPSASSR